MKILHVITGLGNGGAEAVLYRLVTSDRSNAHEVVALMDQGVYGERLASAGVPVHCLGMSRGSFSLGAMNRLYRLVRSLRPEVVQTWMYHADLMGGVAARSAGAKVVWGIRGPFNRALTSLSTRVVVGLCAVLSRSLPSAIVCNSRHAAANHVAAGYAARKLVNIPNGYPLDVFEPNAPARDVLRVRLGVAPDAVVIGMVARFDPYKDHATLLAAVAEAARTEPRLVCILCGTGMTQDNAALRAIIAEHRVEGIVKLLGACDDVQGIMAALDLHVLSSAAESFPNVLVEAMACGTPCVSTDAGDAALIVGETGWIVSPRNPHALGRAIASACEAMKDAAGWRARREQCRERVVTRYSLERMIGAYTQLWRSVASGESFD